MYRIKKFVSEKNVILADPDTGDTEGLGFTQPVAVERLIPLDLTELECPIDSASPLWIDIKSRITKGGDDRWLTRQIVSQSATGRVTLRSVDGKFTETVDLANYEWRWRSESADAGEVIAIAVFYDVAGLVALGVGVREEDGITVGYG